MSVSSAAISYLGATPLRADQCLFRVWAPFASRVDVHLEAPAERLFPLSRTARGYHEGIVDGAPPGALYRFRLDGAEESPDPASRHQPQGVHGPSEVVERDFNWSDEGWHGVSLRQLVLYELHVGAFTDAGTFDAVIPRLDELRSLGVTAIELMPVAQFPGERNWGYDGVYPFAVQSSYGGPHGLRRLVDACHAKGLAVALDVVYNHLGPEGNYLEAYGPYFTDRYRTPWGKALNFDGAGSDEVRRYFIENALYWLEEFHVDILRLDAVHAIVDNTPRTFLEELAIAVDERIDRRVHLIPESAANDSRLVRRRDLGGHGFAAVWNDDFHHSLRTLLTDEHIGYYQDYGELSHLEKAFREGFAYSGEYSAFRQRRHGVSSRDLPAERFVVFSQNHDQVGNRLAGDRLTDNVSLEKLKVAAGSVLLSPYLPLLFMGEEYGETAPFPYFVSHGDPDLIEAVREGRKEEFAGFGWEKEPPDPQDERTFRAAKPRWDLRAKEPHRTLLRYYQELIALRTGLAPLVRRSKERMKVVGHEELRVLELHYWTAEPVASQVAIFLRLGEVERPCPIALLPGRFIKRLDSADPRWRGPGVVMPDELESDGRIDVTLPPWSLVVYEWSPGSPRSTS